MKSEWRCFNLPYVKHFVGEVINNQYQILELTGKDKSGYILAKFQCPYCDNIFNTRIADVSKGHTKSCGCLAIKTRSENGKRNVKDYTGQQIGLLTVLYQSDKRNLYNRAIYWHCRCQCGNEIEVPSYRLPTIQSCGCLQSKAEYKINQIFTSQNIPFETQKTFSTCKINEALLRFDFYLPNENILIEYDGIQHFQCTGTGWDTQEKLKKTQRYDDFKNNWCKENHIPLIRIPYTQFNNLSWTFLQTLIKEASNENIGN